jgi:putative hydrolase of the HAD superfamily
MSAEGFNSSYARHREWRHSLGTREVTLSDCLREIIPGSDRDQLVPELINAFMEEYEAKTTTQPGVESMLEAWSTQTRLAVLSNFFLPGFPERLVKRHGLFQYFEFVIDSAQIGRRKPAPEAYLTALNQARINPSTIPNVFFVGDDWASDVEGARQFGMTPFHYANQESPKEGVARIRTWDEFRPPTA